MTYSEDMYEVEIRGKLPDGKVVKTLVLVHNDLLQEPQDLAVFLGGMLISSINDIREAQGREKIDG